MFGINLLLIGVFFLILSIIKIYYSFEIKIDVIFYNGVKKEILVDEFEFYCIEKGNFKN